MTERAILEAAAKLNHEDIEFIKAQAGKQSYAQKPETGSTVEVENAGDDSDGADSAPADQTGATTNPPERPARQAKRGKRSRVKHEWPEVGTIIQASYMGQRYTAEIIPAPPDRKLKSGRMIRITSGPASGTEHISMSGAMEAATQKQREDEMLGRKGMLSGWDFWRW